MVANRSARSIVKPWPQAAERQLNTTLLDCAQAFMGAVNGQLAQP